METIQIEMGFRPAGSGERGKTEKNQVWESNLGHIDGRQVLLLLCYPHCPGREVLGGHLFVTGMSGKHCDP